MIFVCSHSTDDDDFVSLLVPFTHLLPFCLYALCFVSLLSLENGIMIIEMQCFFIKTKTMIKLGDGLGKMKVRLLVNIAVCIKMSYYYKCL